MGWHTCVQSFWVCSWIFVSFRLEWVVNLFLLGTSGNFEGLCWEVLVLRFIKICSWPFQQLLDLLNFWYCFLRWMVFNDRFNSLIELQHLTLDYILMSYWIIWVLKQECLPLFPLCWTLLKTNVLCWMGSVNLNRLSILFPTVICSIFEILSTLGIPW